MSDIDFLDNKKSGEEQKPKNKADKKPEVIWSEAERRAGGSKTALWSFLPFLNKKKPETEAVKRPAQAIDQNKIKRSRQEILQLIKNGNRREAADGNKVHKNLFASLSKKLAKQPDRKEIMIDYQRIFNQEKAGRSRAGRTLTARPAPADKIEPVKSLKIKAAIWLNKLMEFFRPKQRPLKEKGPAVKSEAKSAEESDAPAPGDVLETNLIKGEIVTFFDWREKIMIFIGAILASALLVASAHFSLLYYQKQSRIKNQEQAQKFEEITGKINQAASDLKEISDFQAKLKTVSLIFSQHLYWTNFFKFLEDNTIKDVYYGGFDGDTGGHYALDALAATFSNISEQVDVLKSNEKIIDAKVLGGELVSGDEKNKTKVKFTLEFSVLKKIFTE